MEIASVINVDRSIIKYNFVYVADINHRRHFQHKTVAIIIIIIIVIRVLLSTHPSCSLEEDQSVEMFCFFRHLCICIHVCIYDSSFMYKDNLPYFEVQCIAFTEIYKVK